MSALIVAIVVATLVTHRVLISGPPRPPTSAIRSARRLADLHRRHPLLLPVLVGFALRIAWVLFVTETPPNDNNDANEYLRMADDFTRGRLPTFLGEPSAFFAPGYSLVLAPFVAVGKLVGGPSPAMIAAVINAVAGGLTVIGVGWLANRWIGRSAAIGATWLMALAPAHIYFTASAHAETVFAAMLVWLVVVVTRAVDRSPDGPLPDRTMLWIGLAVGFAVLVRSPGLALLVAPALAIRATRGSWRGAARTTLLTVAGAAVVLVPWAITNGVYIGVWSPLSTQNATVLCVGHHDDATGGFPSFTMTPEMQKDCYTNSPFVDPELGFISPDDDFGVRDEAKWYTTASRRGIGWALTHPIEEIGLVREKFVRSWGTEWDALPAGKNYTDDRWAGGWTDPLNGAANGWLWVTEALIVLSMVFVPACRRAVPIWALAVILAAAPLAGLAQPHFRHPAIPFLVVIAGGVVGTAWDRRRSADRQPSSSAAR